MEILFFVPAMVFFTPVIVCAIRRAQEREVQRERAAAAERQRIEAAERNRRAQAVKATERERKQAQQAQAAAEKQAQQAARRAERERKQAQAAAERAAKLEAARKLAEYEERALAARRGREAMEHAAGQDAAETFHPDAEPKSQQPAEQQPATDPTSAEIHAANESKAYSFDGETMTCNGRAYAVEFAISRSMANRVPTVTAFCWVTVKGQRRRMGIRFERGSRHHAAALAAAQAATASYRASRAA